MTTDVFRDIERLERDLWEAADNLRANSKLTSSDYFMPLLGVIFLRHAANRFDAAKAQIEADLASGRMPKRRVLPADYIARRALFLPENARYDWLMQQAALRGNDLPSMVTEAMVAIEAGFEPLQGVLPKDYGIFEPRVLEDVMRLFDGEQIRRATGDVFGRIYEYFLARFSIQKAHDNGEFFTPASIVQALVNVIEPDHGIVLDPACGSGGMFVQSSHFIEQEGLDTARRVTFFGQEKNPQTIQLAKMNLAVHGLEGRIAEAITYYQDEHELLGKCDFVMANPPFNVDLVDAERIAGDPRLPFGLPGVNAKKKVGNANYLWISYFWSYLSPTGRAGFVMSSQASSAGHGEKEVRRKLVETGDVDVMMSVRGNFFYTRTVPCELWHFDRGKPAERRDSVLMLDARQVYRKVNRTICDFSPEQTRNLSAIVWLYRGQQDRYLGLVRDYFDRLVTDSSAVSASLDGFDAAVQQVRGWIGQAIDAAAADNEAQESLRELTSARTECDVAVDAYRADAAALSRALEQFAESLRAALPTNNAQQHAARVAFAMCADGTLALSKQLELVQRLLTRVVDSGGALAEHEALRPLIDRRAGGRLVKALDAARRVAADVLHAPAYTYKQICWLHERFPDAVLVPVPGLVKLVSRADIAAADWSLTPGRYVGVAPQEIDDAFDFEETMREIHAELAELDREAASLGAKIQVNFVGMSA